MKTGKKILAAVLTAVMMISMLPAAAFAAEPAGSEGTESGTGTVLVSQEEQDVESTIETAEPAAEEAAEEASAEEASVEEAVEEAPSEEAVIGEAAGESSEEETPALSSVVEEAAGEEAPASEEAPAPEEAAVIESAEEEVDAPAAMAGSTDGSGFPASFTYSSRTYSKSGDPVGLPANFRIQGLGQTNWLADYEDRLNGQQLKQGTVYYQKYTNGSYTIYVYELPSLLEVMEGTGLYITPGCINSIRIGTVNEHTALGGWRLEEECGFYSATGYRVRNDKPADKHAIGSLQDGLVTYAFMSDNSGYHPTNRKDFVYYLSSGSTNPDYYVAPTYTITYKDGAGKEVFEDQVYKDDDAVGGNKTPHFKWNGQDGDPERYGYRFAGWEDEDGERYPDSDAVADITLPEKLVNNDNTRTYTAIWEKVSITVSKHCEWDDNLTADDIDHTVCFALFDQTLGRYVTVDGEVESEVLCKSTSIADGVAGESVTFGVSENIPAHTLEVREIVEPVSGQSPVELNAGNSQYTSNNGIPVIVIEIKKDISNASGEIVEAGSGVIAFGERNNDKTYVSPTDTYVEVTNTYAANEDEHIFTVSKKWVGSDGSVLTDEAAAAKGYRAVMTLYQQEGSEEPEEYETITLDGSDAEAPWTATFTGMPFRSTDGELYHYMVRETGCTEGFAAYENQNAGSPMEGYIETSGGTIYNKQAYFTIYHSSDGSTEKVPYTPNMVCDLTSHVKDGYLYGGYFHYENNQKGDPYYVNGRDAFKPEEGRTYYLKEVDPAYLKPAVYLVYNKNHQGLIQGLYGFIGVDDAKDYTGAGLEIGGSEYEILREEEMTDGSITVTRDGAVYDTLTASGLFGLNEAVFGYKNISSLISGGALLEITGYFTTHDGLKVTGTRARMLQFDKNVSPYNAPVFTGWNSAGNTKTGLKTVASTITATDVSAPAGSFMVAPSLSLAAPSEKVSYTVTKYYSSGAVEKQTVEEGDNTGKISYAVKKNYAFAGWYMDKDYSKAADFSSVSSDMTVYAKYVANSNITVTLKKKSVSGSTTKFDAAVTVKNKPCKVKDVAVTLTHKGSSKSGALSKRSVTKSGKGKNIKYTTKYSGTVSLKSLAKKDSFSAVVTWVTPDGTAVTLNAKRCTYKSGKVTVK